MSFHEPKDPEENLPDWLKELRRRQREAEQNRAEGDRPEDEQAEDRTPDEEAAAKSEEPATPPGDQPDWLKEIRRRHEKEAPSRPEPPAAPAAEDQPKISDTQPNVPLQPGEMPGLEEDVFPEETAPIGWDAEPLVPDPEDEAEDEVLPPAPAWLADDEPEEVADHEAEVPAPEDVEDEPPDWLADDEPEEIAEHQTDIPAPEGAEDEPPDWLAADAPSEEAPDSEAQETADAALPDWLAAEMAGDEDAALRPEERPAPPPSTEDLPDWLLQEEPEDPGPQAPAFEGIDEENRIELGDLPSWLQALRPPEAEQVIQPSSSRALLPDQEGVGPLAGLSGVLPAEPDVVRFGTPKALSGRLQVSEGQQRHAATFSRLVAEEGRAKEDFSEQVAGPSRILNWVIAGALLLASAIPVLTGSQDAARPPLAAYPEAAAVHEAIDNLPANAPVLVAFDVEPALYGEVQAPATRVLQHLLAREARLVFISTQATGPALAERLLADNLAIEPAVATGTYINLGYLSGGIAALRAFASDPQTATSPLPSLTNDPWAAAPLNAIGGLDDFGLVLVISGDGEEARAWIEQSADSLAGGLYMVASAQVAPLARPYLDSHPQTLRGLVSGLSGAAHYEMLRGDGPSNLGWDAFSYGLGAMVVAILLGGLYNRLIHIRPEATDEEADA